MATLLVASESITGLTEAKNTLEVHYRVFMARSASDLFYYLQAIQVDMILLGEKLSDSSGIDTLRRLRSFNGYAAMPVIILTDKPDSIAADGYFSLAAADYIELPVLSNVLINRVQTHLDVSSLISVQLKRHTNWQYGIIAVMAELINSRDKMTGGHVFRTSEYLRILLEATMRRGLYTEETHQWKVETLVASARLHDIGKISVSDMILNKPGKLTEAEFNIIKSHTSEGERIIEKMAQYAGSGAFLRHAKLFAGAHHERWDGSGYPRGLKGAEIPLEGRILAVADVYDALVSERPYKEPITGREAREVILFESGQQFDPHIVEVFCDTWEAFNKISRKNTVNTYSD